MLEKEQEVEQIKQQIEIILEGMKVERVKPLKKKLFRGLS